MKATIVLPDDLYRKVKAKAALLGRPVRDVTIELYQRWVDERPTSAKARSAAAWLDDWTRLGQASLRDLPDTPTARDLLMQDRDRLGGEAASEDRPPSA